MVNNLIKISQLFYIVILFNTFLLVPDNFPSTGRDGLNKLFRQENHQMASILISSLSYLVLYTLNDWLFTSLQFHTGAHWIYLPAGLRLLCTLLMGAEGAIGLFIGSLLIFITTDPNMDPITLLVAAVISAGIPYIIYRAALSYGMPSSLENLSVTSLFVLVFAYALMTASAHSIWFWLQGISDNFLGTLSAMFIGDLSGTLIVIYSIKISLSIFDRARKKHVPPNED